MASAFIHNPNEQIIWEGKPSLRILVVYAVFILVMLSVIAVSIAMSLFWGMMLVIPIIVLLFLLRPYSRPISILDLFRRYYWLTNQRIVVRKGLLTKDIVEVDLVFFRATATHQNIWARLLGIGDVYIQGKDNNVTLLGITDPLKTKELTRVSILDRRQAMGLRFIDVT